MGELSWRHIGNKLWEQGKYLIYCANCQEIFTIRQRVWHAMFSLGYDLGDIEKMANCCEHPNWYFYTGQTPFIPSSRPRFPEKNWLDGLQQSFKETFVLVEACV